MIRRLVASLALASVAATAALPVAATGPTLVDRAVSTNERTGLFDTLLTAATCSYFDGAVVEVLSAKGQKTLFAPTDDAFAALSLTPDNVCAAFEATPDVLLDILLYHVTPGRRPAGWLSGKVGGSITMANGETAAVSRMDGSLAVDGAKVIVRNVPASNGFIHAVDSVLLP